MPPGEQADLDALKREREELEQQKRENEAEMAEIERARRAAEAEAADAGSAQQAAADPLEELLGGFEMEDAGVSEEAEDGGVSAWDGGDSAWDGGDSAWGAGSAYFPSADVQSQIADALQSGDVDAALNLFRSERGAVPEASYLEALRLVPEVRGLAGAAQELLTDYLDKGFDASEGCSLALQSLLRVGALRAAVGVFLMGERRGAALPAQQCRGILRVLGSFGYLKPGVAHIRRMREERGTSEDLDLFNALFGGLGLRSSNDSLQLSEMLLDVMAEAGVRPDSETLGLVLELQMRVGLPGFLTSMGRTLVEFKSRHHVEPGSYAMLVVSAGHLRRGDMEAAYRWFLASRLAEDPVQFGEPEGAQAREYISEIARAFAIGGHARQVLRILQKLGEEGGWLPASASSVSIAGWTSGRTLATAWMEPPAEVLRRRAIWASDPSHNVQVTCAEQFAWQDLDSMRHEVYQWSPYLAPDVKPERAWLVPLRTEDTGGLGLMRDWMGEGPAAAAARERLGEQALPGSGAASISVALDRALKLRPPRPRERVPGAGDAGVSPLVLPTPRSWRAHHADAVHRSFLTPARTRSATKEELAEVMLNDPDTRRLVPGGKVTKPIRFDLMRLEETLAAAPEDAKQKLLGLTERIAAILKDDLNELLGSLGLLTDGDLLKGEAVELAQAAVASLRGELTAIPVPEEDYEEYIRGLSEEELEEMWRGMEAPGMGGMLSSELAAAVAEEVRRERAEDEEIEGSAADELQLALEISSELCQLGTWPTNTDLRALCTAAHAANEPELAADLLKTMADELHGAFVDPMEEEETSDAERPLGPASEALVDAMELGGWEPASSRAFLAGKRQLPQRAGGEGLGGLLTRYLDPLLGHSRDDPAQREEILVHLREFWQGEDAGPKEVAEQVMAADEAELTRILDEAARAEEAAPWEGEEAALEEDAEASEAAVNASTADVPLSGEGAQIWINNGKGGTNWKVVTEASVLRALLQRPVEADSWLLNVEMVGGWSDRRRLMALGLPAPWRREEVKKLARFARSVWSAASRRRAFLQEALRSDALV